MRHRFGSIVAAVLIYTIASGQAGYALVGLFGQRELFGQLWIFWVAPIVGAIAAGFFDRAMFESSEIGQKAHPDRQVSDNL